MKTEKLGHSIRRNLSVFKIDYQTFPGHPFRLVVFQTQNVVDNANTITKADFQTKFVRLNESRKREGKIFTLAIIFRDYTKFPRTATDSRSLLALRF